VKKKEDVIFLKSLCELKNPMSSRFLLTCAFGALFVSSLATLVLEKDYSPLCKGTTPKPKRLHDE
jgi:hypothetical protein